MKKKIFILGAGISGLSLAFYLRKRFKDELEITIFEAQNRVGGWIQTKKIKGCLFECGPRSFRVQELPLIKELGLQDALITANPHAKTKYVAKEGILYKAPDSIGSFLTTALGRKCLKALLSYPFRRKKKSGADESCQSYFHSHFGKDFTDSLINPLMAGIYAAHPEELSYQASFPSMKRGRGAKIYSFTEGMEMLPQALGGILQENILLQKKVHGIREHTHAIELLCDDGVHRGDFLFSTLSMNALRALFAEQDPLFSLLPHVPQASVVSVSLGYYEDLFSLSHKGFGFVVPSTVEKNLLGVVFDSNVFCEQNASYKTRLSIMLGGTRAPELLMLNETELIKMALSFCQKYLGQQKMADSALVTYAHKAISNYPVGHLVKLAQLENYLFKEKRRISLLGAGLYGVSVVDCIQQAEKVANNF